MSETREVEYVQLAASKTVWRIVMALLGIVMGGFGVWMTFIHSQVSAAQGDIRQAEVRRGAESERIGRLEEKIGGIERSVARVETNVDRANDKLDRLIVSGGGKP